MSSAVWRRSLPAIVRCQRHSSTCPSTLCAGKDKKYKGDTDYGDMDDTSDDEDSHGPLIDFYEPPPVDEDG
jgi:hypothetical protein